MIETFDAQRFALLWNESHQYVHPWHVPHGYVAAPLENRLVIEKQRKYTSLVSNQTCKMQASVVNREGF